MASWGVCRVKLGAREQEPVLELFLYPVLARIETLG